jgi:hypothetical protein
MDFDQEGAPSGGNTAILSGGQHPQSFEDIAKEISENLLNGRGDLGQASNEQPIGTREEAMF